ncbi:MAG: hypothetical protein GY841_11580, partial [FCB group bacterium]|nr:hypothetical protein [FCB group bacterium]
EIPVPIIDDLLAEPDETLVLSLTSVDGATVLDGEALGTIDDDDETLIAIHDVEIAEGDAGTTDAFFTVALAAPSHREIRVDYLTVPATATAGDDYLTTSGTLVFAAGVTERTLAVTVVGDVILESDETFRVELFNAVNATIADGVGVGTILDDEVCAGPNLLVNPGAEARPEDGGLPGWTMVLGSDWQRRFAPPEPAEGQASFFAGTAELAELIQDVEVTAYAARIAAGDQHFAFDGWVRTYDEVPPDVAIIIVEYRDASNIVALDTFDSGEIANPYGWHQVSDVRAAPAGTGWIRVRLVSNRFTEGDNDGYFDALSLRSLRAPTVQIDDVTIYEGHTGLRDAIFTVDLACAVEDAVSVDYLTCDVTALADEDYLETSGSLTFPANETTRTVPVPVIGDQEDEPDEDFLVELSNLSTAGDPVLLDPLGVGTILNDDFCPRSHG